LGGISIEGEGLGETGTDQFVKEGGRDGNSVGTELHEPADDLRESGLGDREGDAESLVGKVLIDLGWVVGSLADVAGLVGVELDDDGEGSAATEHAKAVVEIGLGVPVFRMVKATAGVKEGADATGVEVTDGLGLVVPADGVPFPEVVVEGQDIDVAESELILALGEVGEVEGFAVGDSLGELLEDGGRGLEGRFRGDIDGSIEPFDVDDDLFGQVRGKSGEGLAGELNFRRGGGVAQGSLGDKEADQLASTKADLRESPVRIGEVKPVPAAIEGDRGAVLILEDFEDALDGPLVTSNDPGQAGFGRVISGTELLKKSLIEFDSVEPSPFSFDQRVRRHGGSILKTLPAGIAGLAVVMAVLLGNGAGKVRGVGRVRAPLDRQLGRLAWVGSTEERVLNHKRWATARSSGERRSGGACQGVAFRRC
jgi:hypothetical protein